MSVITLVEGNKTIGGDTIGILPSCGREDPDASYPLLHSLNALDPAKHASRCELVQVNLLRILFDPFLASLDEFFAKAATGIGSDGSNVSLRVRKRNRLSWNRRDHPSWLKRSVFPCDFYV